MMDSKSIVYEDFCGSVRKSYYIEKSSDKIKVQSGDSSKNLLDRIRYFFHSAFLPEGYPHSVSKDYYNYQKWDSMQALCSSITGLLSTRAILQGVGVGEASATPAAAALQWLIRDGTGMVGRITFAWFQGSNLDCNSKTWRLGADVLNDLGMMLEILSPLFPQFFLLLFCAGNVAKAIVGVAGGATRAAITQHQACSNNMADVSAKDGSQETAVNLLGMILGLLLTPYLDSQTVIWFLFCIFTFLHLFANYRAVSSVVFSTLNQQRASIAIEAYNKSLQPGHLKKDNVIPSPNEVAKKESLWIWRSRPIGLNFGAQISSLSDEYSTLTALIKKFEKENYLLEFDQKKKLISIVLHKDASPMDILKSFFHAENIIIQAENGKNVHDINQQAVHTFVNEKFEDFVKQLKASGWNLEHTLLGPKEWRSSWMKKLN